MFVNPSEQERCAMLKGVKNIAVIGLSPNQSRPSYSVARAMQGFGFNIIPVRPKVSEVLGQQAFGQLSDVPVPIDLVNVFRSAEYLDEIVDECIALKLPALWIQQGIVNEPAAQRARDAGMVVVMDRCVYRDYAGFCL